MSTNAADRARSSAELHTQCRDEWVRLSESEFHSGRLPKPVVHEVTATTVTAPTLREIYDYWDSFARIDNVPHIAKLDPIRFRSALGNVMLIEPLEGGEDFRYRLYGSNIATRLGRDMTGKRVSEIDTASHVSRFFIRSYIAVMETRRAYRTIHVPPSAVTVSDWERLILPICDENGTIDRLLVGNIPGAWRPVIDAAPYAIARTSRSEPPSGCSA